MSDWAAARNPPDAKTLGLLVGMGGLCVLVAGWIAGSWLVRLVGFVGMATGTGLYARARLAERSAKIDEAKQAIGSELDGLDPVARAQVLADLAKSHVI